MLDRLNPAALIRGQWKTLSDYRNPEVTRGDRVARAIVYLGPLTVGFLVWKIDGRISSPGPLLAGVALLTGGLLSTFTHLSTLRLKLTKELTSGTTRNGSTVMRSTNRLRISSWRPTLPPSPRPCWLSG